jgi:hypothetical protein
VGGQLLPFSVKLIPFLVFSGAMDSGEEDKTGGAKVRNPIKSPSISDELHVSTMTV